VVAVPVVEELIPALAEAAVAGKTGLTTTADVTAMDMPLVPDVLVLVEALAEVRVIEPGRRWRNLTRR
jgi:hypothetical protein